MKKIFLAAAVLLATQFAKADTSSPAWLCNMNFNGKSKGLQLIVGKTTFNGNGTLVCVGLLGQSVTIPVNVKIQSAPIAPTVSIGKMQVYGEAFNISLFNTEPMDILGNYLALRAEFAVGVGAGGFVAVKPGFPDLNLNVGLQFNKGLGFHLGIEKMTISLDETRL